MWPLTVLWGCLLLPGYRAMVGPKEISGFEGDTVSLQCTYREELKTYSKYWCRERGIFVSHCSNTIYAREDGQETTEGRVSIQDSPQTLTLSVTLRKLTLQDAGKYFCGVSKLGRDESFLVSLLVFPASPGLHQTVTTAKQGKTGASASAPTFAGTSPYGRTGSYPYTGTSPRTGSYPYTGTSPYAETSPHEATSPHAGTSRLSKRPDSSSAEDTTLAPSSSSSVSRVSIPMVRILAPVLVLLALLLAAGLAALGSYLLRWRKEAHLAAETQRNEKVHLSHSHSPLEYPVINPTGPSGPHASPEPAASPCTEIQCLSQSSEESEAPLQDPEENIIPGPPLHMSEEELCFSKFISV
ncbi:CMRF35-like molecule 9 isoform X2 [Canis lupus baileyi]|uniref:CMRF35-like molecule 9 isoform X1 n=1 Tax=Canis lupus familiaris TaxID=9615 RepID=UPI000BAA217E|nr:CMRF35-like molecule 9 isoform X1 [Canis lupus familiaris]XP_025296025.1 CMRF35-like molecule 9 isoform X2 [Canis lupus dingo]XP_038403109.1 CMRF35-like molecule 9 isoform X1 [Canis lupus familiaris]XP_038532260.1 CMRF35-like molecule 9 isoform X1 [Canis lupus familiaris]|eukprot:XP_022278648.1 CMRF35-like molecule 9 isoform X1 [Canis lupus familiaris]